MIEHFDGASIEEDANILFQKLKIYNKELSNSFQVFLEAIKFFIIINRQCPDYSEEEKLIKT